MVSKSNHSRIPDNDYTRMYILWEDCIMFDHSLVYAPVHHPGHLPSRDISWPTVAAAADAAVIIRRHK